MVEKNKNMNLYFKYRGEKSINGYYFEFILDLVVYMKFRSF